MDWDVFNGDADGICALHQLRLAAPADARLITGAKRDIALLGRVPAESGDRVTVLDISMDSNLDALVNLLASDVSVTYFDHHFPGRVPDHPRLQAFIDTTADTCTSLLVDRHLEGRFRPWAIVAAFGDNLEEQARLAAHGLGLSAAETGILKALGEYLNYNAYGENVSDLRYHPADLYQLVHRHTDPFAFVAQEEAYRVLREGYAEDLTRAQDIRPVRETAGGAIYILPDTPWAKRISGAFANELTRRFPGQAHGILTPRREGGYTVGVRSPRGKGGADSLCHRFPGGGGRQTAAGINHLPVEEVERFVTAFSTAFADSP